jgi:hypothetical protein
MMAWVLGPARCLGSLRREAIVMTRASPAFPSQVKRTGVTCGEPSGRQVVSVPRAFWAREFSVEAGRSDRRGRL